MRRPLKRARRSPIHGAGCRVRPTDASAAAHCARGNELSTEPAAHQGGPSEKKWVALIRVHCKNFSNRNERDYWGFLGEKFAMYPRECSAISSVKRDGCR